MNYFPLILLAVGGIILTLGDIAMKKWVVTNSWMIYGIGMVAWIIGLNFLALSFRYKNIAVASLIFVLFNIITLLLFSYFYFKEGLSTFEIIGMILGVSAIIFLELGN
jgi:multidrug transporter EmrE-like cation transporter